MSTCRAVGRATLARQLLLERAALSPEQAVSQLAGMQAQAPQAPYIGLWSRLDGFRPGELSTLLLDRRVVRIPAMRGTVHLLTADDCLVMRPWTQPVFERDLRVNTLHAAALGAVDLAELAAAARDLVEERPRSTRELGTELRRRWPALPAASLAYAARGRLPLVQVPPRGLWGESGQPTLTTAEAWLGRPVTRPDPAALVARYLAAFGPATVRDAQTWSGLTGLGEVFGRLPLLRFRDENGRELYDLPGAPRPDPDVLAPVRFLAEFDNLLLSHADRSRVIDKDHWQAIARSRLPPRGVLVDGRVRATWRLTSGRDHAGLEILPFVPLTRPQQAEVTAEGERLLAFAAPDAGTRDVLFASP